MTQTYTGKIIDAHHHLWDLSLKKHNWLIDSVENNYLGDYSCIRHSYLVGDFLEDSRHFPIEKSVHIQAGWDRDDPLGETIWLEQLSQENDYPNAIVFYADLSQKKIESLLEKQSLKSTVRGIRQILNWHGDSIYSGCDKNYLCIDEWRKNFNLLKKYDFSFDMQIYPEQVDEACSFLKSCDEIPIVINHALMPMERNKPYLAYWRKQLKKLSTFPNVYIKISGLAMFDHHWTRASFKEIILPVVDSFSPMRCMVGSNFPVDKLYISFDKLMSSYLHILSMYSLEEQEEIFYQVGHKFYKLGVMNLTN